MEPKRMCVYVPVGPEEKERNRLVDLLDSLFAFEPENVDLVLYDDSPGGRALEQLYAPPPSCTIRSLPSVRTTSNVDRLGAICAANIAVLQYLRAHSTFTFALKIDTDSLVIGPFRAQVEKVLAEHPDAGLVGLLGDTCNRTTRSFHNDESTLTITRALGKLARCSEFDDEALNRSLRGWLDVPPARRAAFRAVCHHFVSLIDSHFTGQHCQGGAYAMTPQLIERMGAAGYLQDARPWIEIPLGEDRMMGMYAAACGLASVDHSEPGQVFGLQSVGLAFSPSELIASGYRLIHSVRHYGPEREAELRKWFRQNRTTQPISAYAL